ncbi:MAG TPA: glycine oxidase ThiO [Pyrinomonadaceae bacterium]|nr:glycine oxidase ThiO [Pyrinomonadaceae bacterium]
MLNVEEQKFVETADAVIVGGGVVGLSLARKLALSSFGRIVLLERGQLGAEASHAAGGMLAAQAECDRPDPFLELACASRELYPALSLALLEETGINIELDQTGTLYLSFTEEDERETTHRYNWQSGAGLPVERLTGDEARRLEPCVSERAASALRFPLDWQVENRRLVAALATSAAKLGVHLLMGREVEAILIERGRVEGVQTARGKVFAPVVIVAGGAWASQLMAEVESAPAVRVEPVRGQMLCFDSRPSLARHVIYSPRGYLVPRLDGRLLAGSTTERAGFDKRVTAAGIHNILSNALEISPALANLPLVDAWSGLRPKVVDDLPLLGASAQTRGLFYAVGHYRNGILLAPVTAELVAEEVMTGAARPLMKPFTIERFLQAGVR